MRADEALAQSAKRLIVAETPDGLVTIFQQPRAQNSEESFHLRFIPCEVNGHLNAAGTVMVGSYKDLATSLRMAATDYGVGEAGWKPTSVEELERAAPSSHTPDTEDWSTSPHDETETV